MVGFFVWYVIVGFNGMKNLMWEEKCGVGMVFEIWVNLLWYGI